MIMTKMSIIVFLAALPGWPGVVEASAIAAGGRVGNPISDEAQVKSYSEDRKKKSDLEERRGDLSLVVESFKNDPVVHFLRRGLQSEICDEDMTISALTGVEESPLFDVGDVNVLDLMFDKFDEVGAAATGMNVLSPQVICAGAEEGGQLSSLGESLEIRACEKIDFVNEVDVFAFGLGQGDTWSFCAAFNIDKGTFALGQNNILPDLKVSILTVSLDALGISLTKSLALDTHNKMWNNTGAPAVIKVFGHVVIRGTGEIGFKASDSVKGVIEIDASIVIDADYNNNGIAPVLADGSTSVDFAMLLAGKAGIVLTVTSWNKKTNRLEPTDFDLRNLVSVAADVYTVVNGDNTAIQLAASLSIKLQGICDIASPLDLLCDIFDGNSGITGAIRSYANKGGFGIQFALEGFIGLKDDFLEDVLGWPDDGLKFSVTFSLGFRGNALYVCAALDGNEWCWDHCSSDSECEETQFCNVGVCTEDRDLGGACLSSNVCKSGICVGGFCSQCPTLDLSTGCNTTEFCAQQFKLGYRCETKRDLGGACLSNNPCKSGYCVAGFCSQCPTIDSSTACASTEFCTLAPAGQVGLRCKTKLELGGACLSNNVCKSGNCKIGFCSQCPTIDSSTGCASTEFCTLAPAGQFGYRCKTKLDLGGACLSNNVCNSGLCNLGFCSQCTTIDSSNGCASTEFCTLPPAGQFGNRCKTKLDLGGACLSNNVCKSALCNLGFCSQCTTIDSSNGCASTEFCTLPPAGSFGNRCQAKRDLGGTCSSSNACKSGYCAGGFCSQCPTIDSSVGCASTEFCTLPPAGQFGYRCQVKRDLGGACLANNVCKSGYCAGGFCSQCPTIDSSVGCASTEFCTLPPAGQIGYRCQAKRDLGGTCSSSNACKSGFCVGGFCSQCPTIDSSTGCASTEFCTLPPAGQFGYRCSPKRGKGGTCLSNNVCLSNKCDVGFCVDCYRDGTGCTSTQYCNLGGCLNKISTGSVCVENRVCASNKCDVGFCVDCYRSGDGCSSSQYCDLGRCKGKLGRGSWCVESRVCMSGQCAWYAQCT